MAALPIAAGAAGLAHRRSALDRTGQGRLRRDHHGHRPAMARFRRDGRLPRADRDSSAEFSNRAMGVPRFHPRADPAVAGRTHRRGDRRTRPALPAADRGVGQRGHDPGLCLREGTRGVRAQPGGLSPAPHAMADVAMRTRSLRSAPALGEADNTTPWPKREYGAAVGSATAARGYSHRRLDRLLGRTRRHPSARGVRRRRRQGGVDPTPRRHPVLGRHA